MPKAFSEKEKEQIRATLIERGKQLFATYGLKKTNVEDLTRAAGISKGAFYLFFASKEELFFEILEVYEAEVHDSFTRQELQPDQDPRQSFKEFLHSALAMMDSHPLFRTVGSDDYQVLVQRLSPEKVEAHLRGDQEAMERIIARYRQAGFLLDADPALLTGLMRALFMVKMHREEVGIEVFPQVMDLLIETVADALFAGAVQPEDEGAR